MSVVGIADVVDVALVALLLWIGLVWLRRSRARYAMAGIAIVGIVYLLASRLELALTAFILQGFFAVFVIFVVVVFQEDIRRLFEQIAIWGLRRRTPVMPASSADAVVRAVARMASNRTGALIVIPGREPLDRFIEGGASLDAWISEPLLLSLFDPDTPGHDGAVILANNRATRFMVHLPLSADRGQIGGRGTRHAAALGLVERSDALVIVVSEERGTVSVGRDGALRELAGAEELAGELQAFFERALPRGGQSDRWDGIKSRLPEAAVAIALSAALWYLLIPGASTISVDRNASVVVENLPEGYVFLGVEPDEVTVTLEGSRRDLMLGEGDDVKVRIDALLVKLGRRTFQVAPDQVEHAEALRVRAVEPNRVRLSVRQENGSG